MSIGATLPDARDAVSALLTDEEVQRVIRQSDQIAADRIAGKRPFPL